MNLTELVVGVLSLIGAGLVALAGVGIVRLPDPLTRASAVSKAAALGVVFVIVAVAVANRSVAVLGVLVLIAIAHVVTVPLSGMALGRAAYRSGTARPPLTRVDEPAQRQAADDAESTT